MQKFKKKYGKSPIQRNWNRMSELSHKFSLTPIEKAEMSYRIAVQNQYATTQEISADFIEPK